MQNIKGQIQSVQPLQPWAKDGKTFQPYNLMINGQNVEINQMSTSPAPQVGDTIEVQLTGRVNPHTGVNKGKKVQQNQGGGRGGYKANPDNTVRQYMIDLLPFAAAQLAEEKGKQTGVVDTINKAKEYLTEIMAVKASDFKTETTEQFGASQMQQQAQAFPTAANLQQPVQQPGFQPQMNPQAGLQPQMPAQGLPAQGQPQQSITDLAAGFQAQPTGG